MTNDQIVKTAVETQDKSLHVATALYAKAVALYSKMLPNDISTDDYNMPKALPPSTMNYYHSNKPTTNTNNRNFNFFLNEFKPMVLGNYTEKLSQRSYNPRREVLKWSKIASKYAAKYNVSKSLILAIIHQESMGDANIETKISGSHAAGLMQLQPGTARGLGLHVGAFTDERFDPEKNVEAGTKYLSELINKYGGDISLAVAAYHRGPAGISSVRDSLRNGNAGEAISRLGKEGVNYLPGVLSYMLAYQGY